MTEFIRVAAVEDVPPDTGREVAAEGRVIALFNVGGVFHALDGVCPHAGGPLGAGSLAGSVVTCPWHGWQFDVTTGRHCLNSNIVHRQFSVKIEDGQVLVELP